MGSIDRDGHGDQFLELTQLPQMPSVHLEPVPIAIIGMACRLPGDAADVKGLWDMCCEGRSAWSKIPETRMNAEAFFHPDPATSGTFNPRGAHFVREDVGLFDAPFFNISPYEAKAMDPQQRILLEIAYEALENSGTPLNKISGKPVGVYVGASMSDYRELINRDPDNNLTYSTLGTASNSLSNRISYMFDLHGPSFTVDSACSSSLAAFHLACQSLRAGEIRQAIVGGSHLILSPDPMIGMSNLRLYSEEGRCFTYDIRGTGYGRGEGIAAVILKPLHDAITAGDTIRAVIRNTGMNQDGKTNGITLPSKDAQESLIRSVYAAAGLDPSSTSYVEAHGTGTKVGDPIEAEAISCAIASKRSLPLLIGSVKSNIGHLEAASGLAGLIKTIRVLETGLIPPNFDFKEPNENIPLAHWNLKVPTELTSWPSPGLKRASISSFGFGGTNVHVIVEEFRLPSEPVRSTTTQVITRRVPNGDVGMKSPHDDKLSNGTTHYGTDPKALEQEEAPLINGNGVTELGHALSGPSVQPQKRLFLLTASDQACLKAHASNLSRYLRGKLGQGEEFMSDLAFTLAERRSILEWRAVASASSIEELQIALDTDDYHLNHALEVPSLGFIFTGQGAQWPAMGWQLMSYPVFASTMAKADACLRSLGAEWSILNEIAKTGADSRIHDARVSQPATTAIQIGLVELLRSWNIKPTAVVGHSSGEIAAAFSARILDLDTCMRIAYHRGALAMALKQNYPELTGGMLAIGASSAEVQSLIDKIHDAKIVVACFNGPSLVTASGDRQGIIQLQQMAESRGFFARLLQVDVAYHSHHMEYVAGLYSTSLGLIEPNTEEAAVFYSSLHGQGISSKALNTAYWVANLTHPVHFTQALRNLCEQQKDSAVDVLIEIGPHSALQAPVQDLLKTDSSLGTKFKYLTCIKRKEDARSTILSTVAELVSSGHPVNISRVNLNESRKVLADLPSYPWAHNRRHWHESRLSVNHRFRRFPRNDLLGYLVDDVNDLEPRWRSKILLSELPWLRDHKVQSTIVFPFAGYVSMAIQAMYQQSLMAGQAVTELAKYILREITVPRSLVLTEASEVELSLTLKPLREGSRGGGTRNWREFTIYSWTESAGWSEHCRGLVTLAAGDGEPSEVDGRAAVEAQLSRIESFIAEKRTACTTFVDCGLYFERISRLGLQFGPNFQGLHSAVAGPGQCIAKVQIADTASSMPRNFERELIIHPTTLDSCLQSATLALKGIDLEFDTLFIPTFVKSMSVSHGIGKTPGHRFDAFASAKVSESGNEVEAMYLVADADISNGQPAIEIEGFRSSALTSSGNEELTRDQRGLCFSMQYATSPDLLTSSQYRTEFWLEGREVEGREQTRSAERAAFYLAQKALSELSTSDARALTGHLKRLYRFLMQKVAQALDSGVPYQKPNWISSSDSEKVAYVETVESASPFGKLVCAMGKILPAIFRGEVEPLSVMVKDGLLEEFYQSTISLDHAYIKCTRWVKLLGHQNPEMRILEIGAGTGSATTHILNGLTSDHSTIPNFASFDFTDISGGFFERAKTRFERWKALLNYRLLNIEHDPVEQGFEPHSYDLIVASEVLHATARMDNTLRNVRRLLKPGGKLVIIETTLLTIFHNIVFGTLQGWWVGEEQERSDGPTLTEPQWDVLLRQTGFSGLDGTLPDNIDEPDEPALGAVMFSTATTGDSKFFPNASLLTTTLPQEVEVKALRQALADTTGHSADIQCLEELTADSSNGKHWVVLALESSSLRNLSAQNFNVLQSFLLSSEGILWVTRGARGSSPDASMIEGLARVVRSENASVRLITLDLDGTSPLSGVESASVISRVYAHVFERDAQIGEQEFAEEKGFVKIRRVIEDEKKDRYAMRETQRPIPEPQPFVQRNRQLRLKIGTPGLLDSVYFEDDPAFKEPVADDGVEMEVYATGMNFKDVMIGLGQIPFSDMGLECSGVVTAIGHTVHDIAVGDRVCGLTRGGYSNFVRVNQSMVAKIPETLGFTAAATIPVVFCTAYYALIEVARLVPGESLLIHSAAGGVGQAAIMVAQHIGDVEIFATVGSHEKKTFLIENYAIMEDHIFSSRETFFGDGIRNQTNGKGVDVILNSLAGEALSLSWRQCLAPLGRFVEIGKRDLALNNNLEMEKFSESATFAGVDLGVFASLKPVAFKALLNTVLELHRVGALVAVSPITVFGMSDISKAMRLMQSGKHMGKVVINAGTSNIVQVMPKVDQKAVARSGATYLIIGGTGGVGRSIARWLASQGAKYILLASRSGLGQDHVRELVDELQGKGVEVSVYTCDIAEGNQLQRMLAYVEDTMPPIRGVIHGAMVNRDVLFEKSTVDDWDAVLKARVQGVWNLHRMTLEVELDFFVMLGSLSGIIGNRGQAAYAASNTFMDAFAEYRRQQNLPASTIDLGVLADVGFVAEHKDRQTQIQSLGHDLINEKELLALVKAAINVDSKDPHSRSTIAGCKLVANRPLPWWAADPKFSRIVRCTQQDTGKVTGNDKSIPIRDSLKQASSRAQTLNIVEEALMGKVASVSMTPREDIDLEKPMAAYGMDSLVAVEIRNWITNEMSANIPALEFFASSSLSGLAKVVIQKSTLID